jgi:HK97 gp10 family phage protein
MASVVGGVVVTGMIELDRMLKLMPTELNHRILSAANTAAAKPLVERAKSLAPQGKGDLKKSIGSVKIPISKATEIGTVHVGPRRKGGYKGHHGHIVEFGTKERFHKSGKSVGFMPKKPFMAPALSSTKDKIESTRLEFIAIKLHAFMKRSLGKAFIK